MITRVEITNYKCLANVAVDLTPLHAIVGPNDTGKSSFLEGVYALINFKRAGQAPFPPGWDGRELVRHGSDGDSVSIRGFFGTTNGGDRVAITQKVKFFPKGKDITGGSLYEPDNERAKELRSNLGPAMLFRFDPQELARPSGLNPQPMFTLDSAGHGLATLLDEILGDDRERFTSMEKEFCAIFPRYSRLQLVSASASYKHVREDGLLEYPLTTGKALRLVTKDGGFSVRAAQASDGTLMILALLALKYIPRPPSVILLEEPENSVHPKRLEQIVAILREIAEDASKDDAPQVIVASHSPYLLDYLKPEEVTAFTRSMDGTVETVRLSEVEDIENRTKYFMLGEFLHMEGEEKLAEENRQHARIGGGRREE